jgi:hypothetical protein
VIPPRKRRRWETRTAANGHEVIVHLTASAFLYGCTCGISGPQRGSYDEAKEDSQQHLDTTDQPKGRTP